MRAVVRSDVYQELLAAAAKREIVTYGYLMKKFHISRGHPYGAGIVGVISAIDRFENKRASPGFAALVSRKDTGYPGGGYFCYDDIPRILRRSRREGSNPTLSEAEKRYIETQREEIWGYYSDSSRMQRPGGRVTPAPRSFRGLAKSPSRA